MKKLANSHSVIRRTQLKRQLVSIFLLLCIITLSLPITASASATFGSCGQDATWSFDENTRTLTISGTGDMYDYDSSSEKAPWDWPHRLSLTEVVIEPGITSIGNYAFQYCIALTGISIPDSVTSIGSFAFNHCTALNDITIPDSVTSIGNNAFRDCQSINTVTIPNNVTNIEWNLFLDCTSLTKVTIPNNVKKIGSCAFSGCSSLAGITIPDSVKIIDGAAFEDCSSLTSIVIPNGVMSIWIQTFLGCSGLTSITIPDSVTIIGENAFASCSELQDVYYGGTKEQWSKIRIDESDNMNGNNSCLLNANIHFNSTGPSSDSYDSFIKTNAYTEGMFTDVSEKFWGAANIKAAYEYGLMVGTSDNRFSPQSSLSIAQTIVLACRLHNIYRYEGRNTFEGTGSWYQPYVDYAKKEGIVTKVYPSYSKTITRWEFAKILDASFPNEALPAINEIEDNAIPDVKTRYLDRSASLSELHNPISQPSMGVGNFFGLLPESMASSKLFGVELDGLTGRIAQQLYPNAHHRVNPIVHDDPKPVFLTGQPEPSPQCDLHSSDYSACAKMEADEQKIIDQSSYPQQKEGLDFKQQETAVDAVPIASEPDPITGEVSPRNEWPIPATVSDKGSSMSLKQAPKNSKSKTANSSHHAVSTAKPRSVPHPDSESRPHSQPAGGELHRHTSPPLNTWQDNAFASGLKNEGAALNTFGESDVATQSLQTAGQSAGQAIGNAGASAAANAAAPGVGAAIQAAEKAVKKVKETMENIPASAPRSSSSWGALAALFLLPLLVIAAIAGAFRGGGSARNTNLSADVIAFMPQISAACQAYGIPEYAPLVAAVIMQE